MMSRKAALFASMQTVIYLISSESWKCKQELSHSIFILKATNNSVAKKKKMVKKLPTVLETVLKEEHRE